MTDPYDDKGLVEEWLVRLWQRAVEWARRAREAVTRHA